MAWRLTGLLAALVLGGAGCTSARESSDSGPLPDLPETDAPTAACAGCHGTQAPWNPPADLEGRTGGTFRGVGAHVIHLAGGKGAAVACGTCHKVPARVDDPGHLDDQPHAEVVFSGVALTGGAMPAASSTDGAPESPVTCRNVYCHGASMDGGAATEPVWNSANPVSFGACGACHGAPPPAPHPSGSDCSACHGEVIHANGTFKDASKHVDGTVQASATACNSCHGSTENAAPPVDTQGSSDTTKTSVGAHQAHLKVPSGRFGPVSCNTCHAIPTQVGDAGHIDGAAAVVFHGVAVAEGATPAWNPQQATCSGVYCHGATLAGGSLATPRWTKVDGTQAGCGTCHGAPPPEPHVQNDACATCHGDVVNADLTFKAPERHADGNLDVNTGANCNLCHGNADNAAPPVDRDGNSDPSRVTVGAHQAHLKASRGLSSPVACASCHAVPATANASGHADTPAPAEVLFKGLATADGASPAWDRAAATCAGTYCHGATREGGVQKTPVWTVQDGSAVTCASCHGFPPPAPHPQNSNCAMCHPDTAGWDGAKTLIAHPEKHVDGTVQARATTTCHDCHGSATDDAPPVDTHGGSDTTRVTVGAHQAHVRASLSKAIECEQCHVVPATVDAPGHIDAETATVTFGDLAGQGGVSPSWDRDAAVCTNTYCHGATLSGGTTKAPKWTQVDGTQKACGTCHGYPPGETHTTSPACGACHAPTAAADGTIADATHHVDGTLDVRTTYACNSCHGGADNDAPPADLAGQSDTSRVSVGAHQSHLKGTRNLAVPLACTDCHKVPASLEDAGHIDTNPPADLTFGALAKSKGATPSWDHGAAKCSGTYCHGATLPAGGATNRSPTWTVVDGSQEACGTCHGVSPTTGRHPSVFDDHTGQRCYFCHQSTATNAATPAIADKTKHIDGIVEVKISLGGTYDPDTKLCTPACHGSDPGPQYW